MKSGNAIEDCMRERLLEIVSSVRRNLLDLRADEIVIPCTHRIVVGGHGRILEPNLDVDQQPLRIADLELMEADVGPHLERFEENTRRADLEIVRYQTREFRLGAHRSPRN